MAGAFLRRSRTVPPSAAQSVMFSSLAHLTGGYGVLPPTPPTSLSEYQSSASLPTKSPFTVCHVPILLDSIPLSGTHACVHLSISLFTCLCLSLVYLQSTSVSAFHVRCCCVPNRMALSYPACHPCAMTNPPPPLQKQQPKSD